MAFTNDETYLNNINLDAIGDYSDFTKLIQPILLEQAGYQLTSSDKNMNFKDINDLSSLVNVKSGWMANPVTGSLSGITEPQAAKNAGMSLDDWKKARTLYNEYQDNATKMKTLELQLKGNILPGGRGIPSTDPAVQQQYDALAQRNSSINQLAKDFTVKSQSLQKDPERAAYEERLKKLQDQELQQIEDEYNYQNSDEGKAEVARQKALEKQQQEITAAQGERQKAALDGTMPVSDILQKQIQDEFTQFKEAQARNGNIILGDDPFSAVGKGTAAENSLAKYQDNVKAAIQREREAVISGENPLYSQGVSLAAGLTPTPGVNFLSTNPAFTQALPTAAGYSGLPGMTSASFQPFQFNQELEAARNGLTPTKKKSGLLSTGLGALGGVIGGIYGGPMGAGVGYGIGSGLGSSFGG